LKEKESIEHLRHQGEDDAEDGWQSLPGDAGDGVEFVKTIAEVVGINLPRRNISTTTRNSLFLRRSLRASSVRSLVEGEAINITAVPGSYRVSKK
jgi:hypothetical protein